MSSTKSKGSFPSPSERVAHEEILNAIGELANRDLATVFSLPYMGRDKAASVLKQQRKIYNKLAKEWGHATWFDTVITPPDVP
jgi:hypothetical protein